MERGLLWSAVALGCLGWLCGLLLTQRQQRTATEKADMAWPFLLTAGALPILVFLITLPSTPTPPFAPGQGWGRGFVIGAVGAMLAGFVVIRAGGIVFGNNDLLRAAAVVATPYFLSLVAVAVPLLWMRGTIVDALVGVAIGWFCVSFVLHEGLSAQRRPISEVTGQNPSSFHNRIIGPPHQLALIAGAGFAVTLCAVAALGFYRGFISSDGPRRSRRTSAAAR